MQRKKTKRLFAAESSSDNSSLEQKAKLCFARRADEKCSRFKAAAAGRIRAH